MRTYRKIILIHVFSVVITCLSMVTAVSADTWTVDISGSGDFIRVQEAISAAVSGDTIIVLPGTYRENLDFLGKDVQVTGRDGANDTILDGQFLSNVVRFTGGETRAAVLEGFTLKNGQAPYYHTGHAGGESGGGILIDDSSPTIRDCLIADNKVGHFGAGMMIGNDSAPLIENTIITANRVARLGATGGGIYADGPGSEPVFNNILVAGNWAPRAGGVYSNGAATIRLENATITDNAALYSCDGICGHGSWQGWWKVELINSIVYGNGDGTLPQMEGTDSIEVTYSLVGGGWDGAGNFDDDPMFTSGELSDYYLAQVPSGQATNSPAVDAGSQTALELGLAATWTRIDGLADSDLVDLGYHHTGIVVVPVPASLTLLVISALLIHRR